MFWSSNWRESSSRTLHGRLMFKSQPSSSMIHLKSRDLLGGIWHQTLVWDILGFPFHFPCWLGADVGSWVVLFHIGCQTAAHYSVRCAGWEDCSGTSPGQVKGHSKVGWISPNLNPLSDALETVLAGLGFRCQVFSVWFQLGEVFCEHLSLVNQSLELGWADRCHLYTSVVYTEVCLWPLQTLKSCAEKIKRSFSPLSGVFYFLPSQFTPVRSFLDIQKHEDTSTHRVQPWVRPLKAFGSETSKLWQ